MKLTIKNIIGKNCITIEDGEKVFSLIHSELSAGKSIELDFSDVKIYASPFFNAAIGRLLKDIKPEDLNRLLIISNINPVGLNALKRVIENSKQYYSDPNTRRVIDEILSEQSREGL